MSSPLEPGPSPEPGLPESGSPDPGAVAPGPVGPDAVGSDAVEPGAVELGSPDDQAPLEEIVAEHPLEAVVPLRGPLAIGGTAIAGFTMGMVEVVPGFSGATVALVAGIYERMVVTIRQGARVLSLLIRGRGRDAVRALAAIDWAFAIALSVGLLGALFTLAPALGRLIEEHPVEMQAVFLGMVLGAATVAARRLRGTSPWYVLIGVVAAALTFVGLGYSEGTVVDPSPLLLFLGAMVAVCAWILPGVSGAFLLLVLGLYPAVLAALTDRDLVAILVIAAGCVIGLALFSTVLNWALLRAHDLVLSFLVGLMVGSVRVLWPWPAAEGIGSPTLGAPDGGSVFLVAALGLGSFAVVWMFGLMTAAVERRTARSSPRRAIEVTEGEAAPEDGDPPA